MTTRLNLQADRPGVYDGLSAHFSGDGFPGMQFKVQALPPEQFAAWAKARTGQGRALDGRGYAELSKPSSYVKPMTYGAVAPGLFDAIVDEPRADAALPQAAPPRAKLGSAGGGLRMFGRLTWDAIPFNQPIPLITSLVVIARAWRAIALWVTAQGLVALSVERIHHVHRPQADRHHVHRARRW